MNAVNHTPSDLQQGPEGAYFTALGEGRFQIQRCTSCEKHIFYPRNLCPHCGGKSLEWKTPVGTGTVYSFSVISGREGASHHVVLVDLDEGVRMMSRIENVSHDDLRIGMRVKARVQVEEGKGLVVFDRVGESE